MSSCLDETNQSNHFSDDYINPNPEVDFNDEADDEDEDLYADEERLLFIKSLKPVGNSFALVRKSNGDPTFLMYEGFCEDCDNDTDRRITRSITRKNQGSSSVSRNVCPSGLARKGENDLNNGTHKKRVALDCASPSVRPRRSKPRVIKEVDDGHLGGKVDEVVKGLAQNQKSERGNGADDNRKIVSNCLFHNLRPRKYWNPHVVKDDSSDCSSRVYKGRAKRSSRYTWRKRGGLVNDEQSSKVDKGRARRLSTGSRYRRGLVKRRKYNQGGGAKKQSSCVMQAQGGQGNGDVKERSSCVSETQADRGNGAEKGIICKIEALDDQDYGDSNRAYTIWLRNYNAEKCDLGNSNVETCPDSELEVLDKYPQCIEWKCTRVADSNVLDATMEDEDLQYIGERSRPENPQFRKDVEDILGRPYDEREYETLWLNVNIRKPIQGYRELRGHLKAYPKHSMGKSYLDEYLDLQGKLDTFEADLPRKLNVLRGFFYYLKNIAGDGIFKPWLDESCLAIVPRIG
ncbi:hypothetical protein AgCh_008359 [Apium graveolens]